MSGEKAGEVADALERLRGAGARLRQRRREDVVRVLGALLDRLRDPDAAERRAWEAALPEATGFTPAVVRAGLELALAPFGGAALESLADAAAGPQPGAGRRSIVSGFETTAVILGGALPTPTLPALLFPLLLGSPVLAKTSHHDPVTASVIARTLSAIDPDLGACLEVVAFAGDDADTMARFLSARCVVATGSDATIASLAARVRPPRRFVGYGHRLSVAVVGPQALAGAALEETARGLATDVALWDQLGCLSPVSVYVSDGPGARGGAAGADALAGALATALQRAGEALPRGRVPISAAAAIAQERGEAEMRAAAGRPVALIVGDDFTVVREADARPRPTPLHRFVRVMPVSGAGALESALLPIGPHLAGVALAGFGDDGGAMAELLVRAGASRVCPPGRLQQPPLAWHHDGLPPLLPLARIGDVE